MVNSGAVKLGIITKAKTQPCTDCGQSFQPSAMEFDHLPEFVKMFELGIFQKLGISPHLVITESIQLKYEDGIKEFWTAVVWFFAKPIALLRIGV